MSNAEPPAPRRRTIRRRTLHLVRRLHLYFGLFLAPWVVMYGFTAMLFNHQDLWPELEARHVDGSDLPPGLTTGFITPGELTDRVAAAIEAETGVPVTPLAPGEWSNPLMFFVEQDSPPKSAGESAATTGRERAILKIDPIGAEAEWIRQPLGVEPHPNLLPKLKRVTVADDPFPQARRDAAAVFREAGYEVGEMAQPRGHFKLNFLAEVDGQPARVTYVLRDGHVDVTAYDGEDGMTLRHFLLRLHTTHGQPPHWNARRIQAAFVDVTGVAMILWTATGLVMWWQIKRTRLAGAVVLIASLATASAMWLALEAFYAGTRL